MRVRDLAESVGTSVMPVREAVRRLVESGLAEHEPYKGARVRALDAVELENAYNVRILLEGECARLGTKAATPDIAERMHEQWTELRRAVVDGEVTEALRRDELLLGALYSASGNDILVRIVRGLWETCRPYKVVWASQTSGQDDLAPWHFEPDLITAVEEQDAGRAERIVREVYENAKSTIRETLERHRRDGGPTAVSVGS